MYRTEEGLGVIHLAPLPNEGLEVKLWGFDEIGLQYATRLIPMMTGVGQPDFIVTRKSCAWKGTAGVAAMGFFDYAWNISHGSYIQ